MRPLRETAGDIIACMSLTQEEVKKIAYLARMDISDSELSLYQEQLSGILEFAGRLQDLDTSHVEGTATMSGSGVQLREDTPRPGLSSNELFSNAPDRVDEQFRIPPVFE